MNEELHCVQPLERKWLNTRRCRYNMLLCPHRRTFRSAMPIWCRKSWPVFRRRARAEMAMTVISNIATATSIIKPTMISVEFNSVDWFDPTSKQNRSPVRMSPKIHKTHKVIKLPNHTKLENTHGVYTYDEIERLSHRLFIYFLFDADTVGSFLVVDFCYRS